MFQRHFCVFALSFPGRDAVKTIFSSILSQHLENSGGFPSIVQKLAPSLTDLALDFHARVSATFLPTAIKFHYVFNLRDLANVYQVNIRDLLNLQRIAFISLNDLNSGQMEKPAL